jgi:hypothetical protein
MNVGTMNGTHTPGPWELRGSRLVTDSNGVVIAERIGSNGPGTPEANAALIAAAPELLAALEGLLSERYALEEPEEFDEAGNWTSNSPASVKARAAIRKARGQA